MLVCIGMYWYVNNKLQRFFACKRKNNNKTKHGTANIQSFHIKTFSVAQRASEDFAQSNNEPEKWNETVYYASSEKNR